MISPREQTRRSLHGVAELLLAGPSFRTQERIRLTVEPNGFATVVMDGPIRRLHVQGTNLVVDPGTDEGGPASPDAQYRIPLVGTFAEVGRTAGVVAGAPEGLYTDHAEVTPDDEIELDPDEVRSILDAFVTGDAALRAFTATVGGGAEPVLWPEHFDVGISHDEVNYGVSAGDSAVGEPYAYVGPWTPRGGDFWNVPFGAARTIAELGGVDAVAAFFTDGRTRAADPA